MTILKYGAVLAAALTLSACTMDAVTTPAAPPAVVVVTPPNPAPTGPSAAPKGRQDTCGAADYQALIGQKSPAISVPAGQAFRQYRTGDPVTMDLSLERLNFEYDRTGKLISVTCG